MNKEELFKTQYLAEWNRQELTKKECLEAYERLREDNYYNPFNCSQGALYDTSARYRDCGLMYDLIHEHFELIDDYNKVCNEKERYARAYLRMSESSEKLIDRYFETEKTFSEIINTLRSTDLDDYECCVEIAKIVGIYNYERE